MPADSTRKPVGINLAAIVLALMTAVGALFAAGSIAALFFTRHPIIPPIPAVKLFVIAFDILMLILLLWGIWTVVGLLKLRPWARFSILALGALDLFFFGVQSVGLLVLRTRADFSMMMPSGPGAINVSAILAEIAALDALLALIGVWWLVYFSLSHVRLAFGNAPRQV